MNDFQDNHSQRTFLKSHNGRREEKSLGKHSHQRESYELENDILGPSFQKKSVKLA